MVQAIAVIVQTVLRDAGMCHPLRDLESMFRLNIVCVFMLIQFESDSDCIPLNMSDMGFWIVEYARTIVLFWVLLYIYIIRVVNIYMRS